ncbi:MAG: hypothetical protein A3G41_08525, partial [Elusimicrobia bacterium RIFCSPLOWO2_12_FULL_59_9]
QALLSHKTPYVCRGAGTNLSGGCIPLRGGVVLSTALMRRIAQIDTTNLTAAVEPGVVNLDLQKEAERHGLFYAPDPASMKACTLGGNVAENSGGPRTVKYGMTTQHVLALEAVMPDASLQKFSIDDAGPEMMSLLIGAEGTLGVVTKIWVKLTPIPEKIQTILASFSSMEDAIKTVSDIIASGVVPRVLEALDRMSIEAVEAYLHAGYPAGAEAVLLMELDGAQPEVARDAALVEEISRKNRCVLYRFATEAQDRERLWEGRRGVYAAMARVAPNVLVEDGVVPRNRLVEALQEIRRASAKWDVRIGLLFHAGDGNLHPNVVYDERDADQTRRAKGAGFDILKACVAMGGSISGEHGIGVDKRRAMAWLFTPETLNLFRKIKASLDPGHLSNPDKIIPLPEESAAADSEGRENPGTKNGPKGFIVPRMPLSPAAKALVEEVKRWGHGGAAATRRMGVFGMGTRMPSRWRDEFAGHRLETRSIGAILDLDRENYTVRVEAGMEIGKLKEALAAQRFYLRLPELGGTVGGALATKHWRGIRDCVLGMRLLLSNGDVVEVGGKVMKDVAGYEIQKLVLGSWGGLGLILDVTFRLYAREQKIFLSLPAPTPFAPNRWHRLIKQAFDPLDLWAMPEGVPDKTAAGGTGPT